MPRYASNYQVNQVTYTHNGTFLTPPGISLVFITMCGGGGGGAGGGATNNVSGTLGALVGGGTTYNSPVYDLAAGAGGGGGSAGASIIRFPVFLAATESVAITVGNGGAPGIGAQPEQSVIMNLVTGSASASVNWMIKNPIPLARMTGSIGTNGGSTSFGYYVTCLGGYGGQVTPFHTIGEDTYFNGSVISIYRIYYKQQASSTLGPSSGPSISNASSSLAAYVYSMQDTASLITFAAGGAGGAGGSGYSYTMMTGSGQESSSQDFIYYYTTYTNGTPNPIVAPTGGIFPYNLTQGVWSTQFRGGNPGLMGTTMTTGGGGGGGGGSAFGTGGDGGIGYDVASYTIARIAFYSSSYVATAASGGNATSPVGYGSGGGGGGGASTLIATSSVSQVIYLGCTTTNVHMVATMSLAPGGNGSSGSAGFCRVEWVNSI